MQSTQDRIEPRNSSAARRAPLYSSPIAAEYAMNDSPESALEQARTRLAPIVHRLAQRHADQLQRQKANARALERPDFLWHYLLHSFATMGRTAGADGLIGDPANYERVRYEVLAALQAERRLAWVRSVCRAAKVRMPDRKADYIVACFERIGALGGPAAARAQLLAQPGRAAKLAFLTSFPGIGPKYARNIMMDVHHPEFHDSIAIDLRIQSISTLLGLTFAHYAAHEAFYLSVAARAQLTGWALDRLLFQHRDTVLEQLGQSAQAALTACA